jgi:hypothetical protein
MEQNGSQNSSNAFLDLINANEQVDYSGVVYFVLAYLAVLWLLVAIWVGVDAYKRYGRNIYIGLAWGILVFFLNVPGWLLYLIIRPEFETEKYYAQGGLAIPIANFVGEENELLFGLEMKIHSQELTDEVRDMKIDLGWESRDPAKKISAQTIEDETREVEDKISKLQGLFDTFRKHTSHKVKREKAKEQEEQKNKEEEVKAKDKERDKERSKEREERKEVVKNDKERDKDRNEKKEEPKKEEKKQEDQKEQKKSKNRDKNKDESKNNKKNKNKKKKKHKK